MKTIKFDITCTGWTKKNEVNKLFLIRQRDYFNELLKARGYVYLNTIYEALGALWNPDGRNICYRAENGLLDIRFKPVEGEEAFLVYIQQHHSAKEDI